MDKWKAQLVVNQVRAVCTVVRGVSIEDLEEALMGVEYFDSFAPFFDPTMYLTQRESNLTFGDVLKALIEFRRVVAKYEVPV